MKRTVTLHTSSGLRFTLSNVSFGRDTSVRLDHQHTPGGKFSTVYLSAPDARALAMALITGAAEVAS